ncbi:MAG TPA: hypothetical protein VI139_00710, partial [Gemmatimonadales bacterium]
VVERHADGRALERSVARRPQHTTAAIILDLATVVGGSGVRPSGTGPRAECEYSSDEDRHRRARNRSHAFPVQDRMESLVRWLGERGRWCASLWVGPRSQIRMALLSALGHSRCK